MKVLLVMPNSYMHVLRFGSFTRSMREAPLTLTTLAALAPPELNINFTLIDETVQPIPLNENFDLVAISIMTGTADRGYFLANHFRQKGATVVLGGVHATIRPDEAAPHCHSLVIGMAERTWPQLLRDFSQGNLQKTYRENDQKACINQIPTPRHDLLSRWHYNLPNTVMATRGCRHACEFCSVPSVWQGYHKPPSPMSSPTSKPSPAPSSPLMTSASSMTANTPVN